MQCLKQPGVLGTYRLNRARTNFWEWDATAVQTQNAKFDSWRSEAEHATFRSRRHPTILNQQRAWKSADIWELTLWSLNLPLSFSFTTSRELLAPFSTCSGWRWLKRVVLLVKQLHENVRSKPSGYRKLSHSSEIRNYAWMHRQGLRG